MGVQDHAGSADDRVAQLEARLDALLGVVAGQAEQIELLEGRLRSSAEVEQPVIAAEPTPTATDPGTIDAPAPDPGINRRRLLLGGATAAAAATAAVVASTASPAAAANGNSLTVGVDTNAATLTTKLSSTLLAANTDPGFWVNHSGNGPAIRADAAATSSAGVRATNTSGPAITATSTGGQGLTATSTSGTAVQATSGSGTGVRAQTDTGIGLWATTTNNIGVYAVSDSDRAVVGQSPSGKGVVGQSNSSVGVTGTSLTAEGVVGTSNSGNAVRGTSTGGVGVVGVSASGHGLTGTSGNGAGLSASSTFGAGVIASSDFANLSLPANPTREAPAGDSSFHTAGDVVTDKLGNVWVCVEGGTPGTWRKLAGPASAGSFHVLPTPARVYDSRPGSAPSQGPKTSLSGNVARPIDCKVNSSGVPAGCTAVALTILLINAYNGNGNMTIWANGASRPAANTMVWGAGSGRWSGSTTSAVDSLAQVQVAASAKTDLVLDVIGYYL